MGKPGIKLVRLGLTALITSQLSLSACAGSHNLLPQMKSKIERGIEARSLSDTSTCTVSTDGGCCQNDDTTWTCSAACTETPSTGPGNMTCRPYSPGTVPVPPG